MKTVVSDPGAPIRRRHLGLAGVVFKLENHRTFHGALEQLKRVHFDYDPDDPPILHREEVIGRVGPFSVLRDIEISSRFYADLSSVFLTHDWTLFMVVIDKHTHGAACAYRTLKHPYHYCFHVLVERYMKFLQQSNGVGDILVESRGGAEDTLLKIEYQRIYSRGTTYEKKCKLYLTSGELKVKKKGANIAGLQLADMLAYAGTRDVLLTYNRVSPACLKNFWDVSAKKIAEGRYYRAPATGRVRGCGKVVLL